MSCGHEDGLAAVRDDFEHYDDGDICPGCGEPENYCVCDQMDDEGDCDESMDGQRERPRFWWLGHGRRLYARSLDDFDEEILTELRRLPKPRKAGELNHGHGKMVLSG